MTDRIMIFGPKDDGTYVVEFRAATGEVLAIPVPKTETTVIRHFQQRMPFVPEALPDQSTEIQAEIDDLHNLEKALIVQRAAMVGQLEDARKELSTMLLWGDPTDPNAIPDAEEYLAGTQKRLNAIQDALVMLVAKLEDARQRLHHGSPT